MRVPLDAAQGSGFGTPDSDSYRGRFELVNQAAALRITDNWHIERAAGDEWAARSQRQVGEADRAGRFADEVTPLATESELVSRDEDIWYSPVEALAGLRPAFREDGRRAAGNSLQIPDGATAIVIMSRERAERLGDEPLARVMAQPFVGVDPALKLTGPISATAALLDRVGPNTDRVTVKGRDRARSSGRCQRIAHDRDCNSRARHGGQEFAVVSMCCGGTLSKGKLLRSADTVRLLGPHRC